MIWSDDSIALRYVNDLGLELNKLMPEVELAESEPPTLTKQLCESSDIEPSLKWFINSSEYQFWNQADSARLWLLGEHCDGKTVIMSYILKSLSRDTQHVDEKDFASIFCSCDDSEEGVVASLVLQLLQNKVRAKVSRSRFPISTFQSGDSRAGFNRLLWGLLTTLITASRKTVLIIDGIDELDPPIRSSLLNKFGKFEKEVRPRGMRVLISSKNTHDIQSALSHYSSIDREKERRGE